MITIPKELQDPDALNQKQHLAFPTLIISIITNIIIALFLAIWFLWWRTTDHGFRYLTPRRFVWPSDIDQRTTKSLLAKPKTFAAWVYKIWQWDDETLIKGAGYDAVVLFRVLRCCWKILSVYSIYAFAILLPVNYSPHNGPLLRDNSKSIKPELYDDDSLSFAVYGNISMTQKAFYELTIANVQAGDHVSMLAHLVGVILLAVSTIYFLQIELEEFLALRIEYLSNSLRQDDEPPHKQHLRAVIVEEIPKVLRNPGNLKYYMDLLYPGKVEKVIMVNNTHLLKSMIRSRDQTLNNLEHALIRLHVTVHSYRGAGHTSYYKRATKLENTLVQKNKKIFEEIKLIRSIIDMNQIEARESSEVVRTTNEIHEIISDRRTTKDYSQLQNLGKTKNDERMRARSTLVNFNVLDDVILDMDGEDSEQETPLLENGDSGIEPESEVINRDKDKFDVQLAGSFSEGDVLNHTRIKQLDKAKNFKHVLLGAGVKSAGEREFGSKAFVIFNRYTEATLAQQIVHSQSPGLMKVSPCPDKDDCFFDGENWTSTSTELAPKRFLVGVIMTFLILLLIKL